LRTVENVDSNADNHIANVNVSDFIPDIHNTHLDSCVHLRVTEDEFHTLFVQCNCRYILTWRAIKNYICGLNSTRMSIFLKRSVEGSDME